MKSPEERQRVQKLARENNLRNKLANNDVHKRQLAASKRSNDAKRKRVAELKALGIKPPSKPLTERDKERMRIYARRKRAEATAIRLLSKPVKKRTKEIKTPKSKQPKPLEAVVIKPVKMEKILKARPERRISEKVIKPVKLDAAKQPDVVRIKSNEEGKVKVRLNAKTEVWAKPGYDIDALRRKFGIC